MTISNETGRSGPYNGNGVTVVFDYEFRVVDQSHLNVIKRSTDGVETRLVLTSDYSVSGVGDDIGGSVTLDVAPASGETITILRDVPFTQGTDLENQGAYYAEDVERAFDLAAMRDQQLREEIDRSVKIPASADSSTLDELVEDIQRLVDSADNVDTVASSIGDVNAVAGSIANVDTVAGAIADVSAVADIAANVSTVAGDSDEVNALAGIQTEIEGVYAIRSDVSTVAGISADVAALGPVASDITTVADNLSDVTNFADVYLGPKSSDPALRNDGSALQAGDLYFNTVVNLVKVYTGGEWRDTSAQSLNMIAASFTGDGTDTTFDLSAAPGVAANVLVWVGGVRQVPITDYTVSGVTLTFGVAPSNGAAIDTLVVANTSEIDVPAIGSVGADAISDDAGEKAAIREKLGIFTEKGANVASAATVTLGDGNFFHVTGTTTITDIDFSTAYDGRWAILEFDGVLTLTHNATTLNIPGGANITTDAGGRAFVIQDSSDNVHVLFYQPGTQAPASYTTGNMSIGGASSYDVAIPAWARVIHIGLDNVSVSSSSITRLQLGDAGGIETSGYTGGSAFIGGSNIALSSGFDLSVAGITAAQTAEFTLHRRTNSGWVFGGSMSTAANGQTVVVTGAKNTSAETTTLRLTNSAGANFNVGGTWVVTFLP